MRIPSGVTDQYIYFKAVDSADLITPETGLSSFTVVRSRNGAADATYTTPSVSEIDASTMPGVYALLLDEDMTIASGNDSEEVCLHITHAGMAPVTRVFELYRPKITAGNTLSVESDGDLTKVNTLDGHTAQTGDAFARLGAPAGASTAADIAAVKAETASILDDTDLIDDATSGLAKIATDVAAILVDTGTTLQAELDGIQADTEDIQSRLPAALVSGRIDASVGAMASDVLTAAALAADAVAEINATVDTALADYDGPTYAELLNLTRLGLRKDSALATDLSALITTLNADLGSGGGAFANTSDAQEAIRDRGDAAWATATGFSTHSAADVWSVGTRVLTAGTNIQLPANALDLVTAWTVAITGNITGNLSGSVGSVTGAVGSVTGNVGGNVTGSVGSLATQAKADVNAEVDGAIETYHLDHLLAATYDPASKPGAADALLNELVESDAGVSRFSANALEQAPTDGAAPTVGDIADAVLDEALSGHTTAGTLGKAVSDALADTDELQADWANGGRLDLILDARASQSSVDDLPTNAELSTALAAADDAVLAAIAALSIPTAAQNAAGLLDLADAIETGLTVRNGLRIMSAALAGKVTGGATATNTFRNAVADSKDRIVATVDADGNRSAITLDLT